MKKIVINKCFGGFSLSVKAMKLYHELKGIPLEELFYDRCIDRDDPILVRVVEELGKEASGSYARLKIVEIPDDIEWEIDEYDGQEWVSERHRRWS